jgi:Ca2+-binding EF-hand superfamily protein
MFILLLHFDVDRPRRLSPGIHYQSRKDCRMRTLFAALVAALALVLALGGNVTNAQNAPKKESEAPKKEGEAPKKEGEAPKKEGEKKVPDRPRGGGPGAPGGRQFMPPNPLFDALDTNHDGVISEEEMKNAYESLKKLDKNGDGKLTRDEVQPAGFGRGAGGGGFGRGFSAADFVDRIMAYDKNKDGKVTKDELPENLQNLLDRFDENKDGALDKAELEKAAQRFSQRGGRPGQPGAPGAGNPSGRPKRPSGDAPGEKAPGEKAPGEKARSPEKAPGPSSK